MENYVRVERKIDSKLHVIKNHASPEEFLSRSRIVSGINTIWYSGLPIDTLVSLRPSNTLVVVLNGAKGDNVRLPWLAGSGITKGLEVSRVSICDPSLYLGEEIKSSYCAGNRYQPELQEIIAQIVRKIADSAGIEHIVVLGGSNGGFAGLNLSRSLAGSTAVVYNPQTNLWVHRQAPILEWLSTGWGLTSLHELPPNVQVDLTARYSGVFTNRVIYMQNQSDHHHDQHFVPFFNAVGQGDFQFLVHDEAQGHQPPPKEMIRKVLELACDSRPGDLIEDFSRK